MYKTICENLFYDVTTPLLERIEKWTHRFTKEHVHIHSDPMWDA